MIRVNQIKLPAGQGKELLSAKAAKQLKVGIQEIERLVIVKKSLDARKKPDIYDSYILDIELYGRNEQAEAALVRKLQNNQITVVKPLEYRFPDCRGEKPVARPVIIGAGPAGLFCAYFLAKSGCRPLLLERGKRVEERQKDVERFWQTGKLDPSSNVQFGEGGAGTFSDGKLNTLIKDKDGRGKEVLRVFVECGAPDNILYDSKPHIGTDILCSVVRTMRKQIEEWGGEVRFQCEVTDIVVEGGRLSKLILNGEETLLCEAAVLAIGHSARDTFEMLDQRAVPMEAKAFAVGFRVEHPQSMINVSQYGAGHDTGLPAAAYKVAAQTSCGRGVYSFCMCPGGFVVNASSEEGRLAVNGMSYSKRDGSNANSAVIVSVTPADYGATHPLAGIAFQRQLEEKAYRLGEGRIPVQRYGEFRDIIKSRQKKAREQSGDASGEKETAGKTPVVEPCIKGQYSFSDLTDILPEECSFAFVEGMEQFGRLIRGFNMPEAIVSAVESRTSSPVRIKRDENMQSEIRGLYPCGEGAGYAGGITSAAMDGILIAESIVRQMLNKRS